MLAGKGRAKDVLQGTHKQGCGKRFLWCDIICINQRDVAERQRQVQLMARVYRMARRVVIWLGPETGTSALGMQTLRQTGRHVRADPRTRTWSPVPGSSDPRFTWAALQEGYSPYTGAQLGAVLELVSRAWFRRLWTRQEVTLARDAVVVAGAEEMPWPTFLAAVFYMDSLVRLLGRGDARLASALFNVYELGCLTMYENVMEVMHACRSCECTLDVDRVYGLLGLLSSRRMFDLQPDYGKDPKMVYHDAVITLFASSARTDFLELCEEASAPSWVPDLHMLGLGTRLNTRAVPYCHASGSSAGRLDQLDANTVEVAGVYCGALGKPASLVLNKDAEARLLKDAIVDIVRSRMGDNVDLWDLSRLEGLTKGLLGCLWSERTGRNNHSSLVFSMAELAKWVRQAQHGEEDSDLLGRGNTGILFKHITRVLFHGDSCRWTQDGFLGLGFGGCREGDLLYSILGCRRLIALRREAKSNMYRVVGKFDHPRYNDGEALLGVLDPGWKVTYLHGLAALNRPWFEHADGTSQWDDPRLRAVCLPEGWCEARDSHGCPFWTRADKDTGTQCDPRLSEEELRKRGVKVEALVIV